MIRMLDHSSGQSESRFETNYSISLTYKKGEYFKMQFKYRVFTDYTRAVTHIYLLAHIPGAGALPSVVEPVLQFLPTASCNIPLPTHLATDR